MSAWLSPNTRIAKDSNAGSRRLNCVISNVCKLRAGKYTNTQVRWICLELPLIVANENWKMHDVSGHWGKYLSLMCMVCITRYNVFQWWFNKHSNYNFTIFCIEKRQLLWWLLSYFEFSIFYILYNKDINDKNPLHLLHSSTKKRNGVSHCSVRHARKINSPTIHFSH